MNHTTTLPAGAERLWCLLADYPPTTPYTAHGCRAADAWLAAELGVTPRTVRRYRAALAAAGVLRERLNEHNLLEFRLLRLPAPSARTDATSPPAHIRELLRHVEIALRSGTLTIPGLSIAPDPALSAETGCPAAPPHPGQPLSRATVEDGTRDTLSHYEEDTPSLTPLLIDSPPTPALTGSGASPLSGDMPDAPSPPRHRLRTLVESYGVFPDSAHAIANKLAQAHYSEDDTERLLKHLWQETRGQVGLLVYRLTKRALPPRDAIDGSGARPSPLPQRTGRRHQKTLPRNAGINSGGTGGEVRCEPLQGVATL